MLSELGLFDIKKNKCQDTSIVSLVKKDLPLFDKKAFVLKYEFNISVADISYILSAPDIKVKKSLLASVRKVMKKMKEAEDDLR
jgi:DNA-directed RNA polymerase specialized sigma24 family protein